ncbi:GCN5 family N-acetyltransferase [Litchfieldella qijiaojingensis]|uniref:GCN5 family N-acetyltransferase n=1 Tax=Litchfieldella qijiaojingensis TaxID=980347 RepID=A0ABQ2YA08_9GAMM|nr:N-acetyltransferase [Halomonas qijiaojingensis]GGX77022.1 GCN5 family N-acetyltransferase [Halomonas qijiaojingensis]
MRIKIRNEEPRDIEAIEALTALAFLDAPHVSHTEQFIVNELRKAGQLSVSLVAENYDGIVGHVAVSPVTLSDGSAGWYGLGPISVTPERQGQGIGTKLMEKALTVLREKGAAGCVLVGDPNYYSRFGFKAEPSLVLPGVPPAYFQALMFRGAVPVGLVSFHEAFDTQG